MKINFDSLFDNTQPLSLLPNTNTSQSVQSNRKQQTVINDQKVQTRPNYSHQVSIEKNDERQESSRCILEKLNKLTKMVEEQQQSSKKQPKVNIIELTNKLYQPGPSNKKNCLKHQKNTPKQPLTIIKSTKLNQHQSSAHIGCPRYVRLYNLSKINSIRNLYRAQSHHTDFQRQHVKDEYKTKTSQSYLENYVPFYDRLESQVNRSLEKQKFYENNPHFSCGEMKELFKPTTIPDKYKERVECRYNKSRSTRNTNELQAMLNSSLNTSFCSLDKSVQIVSRIQQHFFQKIKLIFLNETSSNAVVNQQTVSMLTELEFNVLQGFIMEAERHPIPNQLFEQRLRNYYYGLPSNQRLQLRNHQTKKKPKTTQELTTREKTSTNSFRRKPPGTSKYLKKVQNFI